MSNLGYGTLSTTDDYVDIETELSISFTDNTVYQIQIKNPAFVCEATNKPTEGGFEMGEEPFQYVHNGEKLWIKAKRTYLPVTVNVASGSTFGQIKADTTTIAEVTEG
ncbi:MAG: hypothetical protein K6E29_09455 [Cyanobacteria bacterium RUI128]|nr:hypothetical protein [Cyanobacteria bacterium RUI128]